MALVTLEELRAYADIKAADKATMLQLILDGISDASESEAGRIFAPDPTFDTADPVTRMVMADDRQFLRIPDARSLSLVEVGARQDSLAELAESEWELVALRAGEPATHLRLESAPGRWVKLTGRFGFAAVPADVRLAVLQWATRAAAERDARQGEQIQYADGGSSTYFRQSMPLVVRSVLQAYRVPVV